MSETPTARIAPRRGSQSTHAAAARVARFAFAVAVAATIVQSITTAVNMFVVDGAVDSLDATVEGGVWTWAAAGAALVAAAAAAVIAVAFDHSRMRFWLLAGVLAYFSLDDWLELHERVGEWFRDTLGLPEYVGGLWVLAYPPLLGVVAWGLWRTAEESAAPVRRALLASLVLLVAAVVVELVGIGTKAIEESGNAVPHDLRAIVEEGVEVAAWILGAGGLLSALVADAEDGAAPFARHNSAG